MYVLNLENWSSGELSKIGHHFRKQSDLKIDVMYQKMSVTKNVLLNCSRKKIRKIGITFDVEN